VVVTQSGAMAQAVARLRPGLPIIAITTKQSVWRRLAVNHGVWARYVDDLPSNDADFRSWLPGYLRDKTYLNTGDTVLVSFGQNIHESGSTDTITSITILCIYLALVWIGLRLLVPHLGFKKERIPDVIPTVLEEKIEEWEIDSSNQREYLEHAYNYIVENFYGSRIDTLIKPGRAFGNVFDKQPGFLPCTMQNYLLRIILVKSKWFKDSDIETVTVPLNLFIHQYLRIQIASEKTNADPWSNFLGLKLGERSFLIG
jgi:hypothetical protein